MTLLGLACVVIMSAGIAFPEPGEAAARTPYTEVSLRVGGKAVSLSPRDAQHLADAVVQIFATCGISSIESPEAQWASGVSEVWRDTEAGSRLLVRYRRPVENTSWAGRKTRAAEIMLGIGDNQATLDPLLSRGETPVLHIKCDGYEVLRLQCAEPLASSLPPSYARNCHLVRK